MSLFYDEELNFEKETKQLDQFARKCRLSEHAWQVQCEIITYNLDFHYGSIHFNRYFTYTTCFKFRQPTGATFVFSEITDDK